MRGELLEIRNYFDCLSDILNKAADRAASAAVAERQQDFL